MCYYKYSRYFTYLMNAYLLIECLFALHPNYITNIEQVNIKLFCYQEVFSTYNCHRLWKVYRMYLDLKITLCDDLKTQSSQLTQLNNDLMYTVQNCLNRFDRLGDLTRILNCSQLFHIQCSPLDIKVHSIKIFIQKKTDILNLCI